MDIDQNMLNSFKEVCAVNDEKARQYLSHCDGDLETAVQLFFQTGGTLQNTHEGENNADNEELELRQRTNQQIRNRAPAAAGPAVPRRAPIGWMEWILAVAALPIRFTITTLWDIFSLFSELILGRRQPALTDPRGDVERFIHDYTQHYAAGVAAPIEFFRGSYNDALKESKNSLRMMLIYLHNPSHNDTVRFVSDVLHSVPMGDVIRQHELIVFGVSVSSPQGAVLASQHRPTGYPFLALLTLRNNKMSVALRLSGLSDAESTALNLGIAVEDHRAQLNILRMQKAQREEDQRIRAEQEREYRESAAVDRARIQERRRLESEKADAEEAEREKERQNQRRKQEVATRRETIRASLADEPTGADSVRVQVRFPSGARFDRRFNPDDSLEALFEATLIQEKCPDFFTMHITYPRKELICSPEWYHSLRSEQLLFEGTPSDSLSPFVPARSFHEEGIDKPLVVMVHDCQA